MTSPRQKKKKLAILKMLKKKQLPSKDNAIVELMKEKANVKTEISSVDITAEQSKDVKVALKELKNKKTGKLDVEVKTEINSAEPVKNAEPTPIESEKKNET